VKRLLDWLLRRNLHPTPEEKAEPRELAEVRRSHERTKTRAFRALSELHRVEQAAGRKHNG